MLLVTLPPAMLAPRSVASPPVVTCTLLPLPRLPPLSLLPWPGFSMPADPPALIDELLVDIVRSAAFRSMLRPAERATLPPEAMSVPVIDRSLVLPALIVTLPPDTMD